MFAPQTSNGCSCQAQTSESNVRTGIADELVLLYAPYTCLEFFPHQQNFHSVIVLPPRCFACCQVKNDPSVFFSFYDIIHQCNAYESWRIKLKED